jgi:diguanylate cyclase (GGDEF)-like protein
MRSTRSGPATQPTLLRQLPWLLLALMLGLTWLAWDHERQITRAVLRTQFDFVLRETVSRIDQRAQGYEQMLRGVQSLFATTSLRKRATMHDYVEALQLDANFSGVQAIGIVEWVPEAKRSGHLAAMRAAGFANYAIQPAGLREVYTPIVQREPYVGRNRAEPGVDVWTDPVRRAALERSRDSGLAAISGKVALKVDDKDLAPPGFVLYLPVYAQGQAHDSVQQRRTHLLGWVYASFHMDDFMASLYGSQPLGLAIAIHDGTEDSAKSLLYGTDLSAPAGAAETTDALRAKEYMVVGGRNWTLSLRTQHTFHRQYGRSLAAEIALAGFLLSVVLAMLSWQMINGREHALAIAAAMTEELRHMAQHDPLTGLPNRALFSDRVKQELAHAQRQHTHLALIFVDLDNFKHVNDHFGHAGGDEVLRRVAAQLRHSVRAADTVGRIGGDEFVVLLAQLGAADPVLELADKIQQAVKQPLLWNGNELHISCSMGIAVYPKDGTDEEALTRRADEAMYRAKAAGRDCIRQSEAGP